MKNTGKSFRPEKFSNLFAPEAHSIRDDDDAILGKVLIMLIYLVIRAVKDPLHIKKLAQFIFWPDIEDNTLFAKYFQALEAGNMSKSIDYKAIFFNIDRHYMKIASARLCIYSRYQIVPYINPEIVAMITTSTT